MRIGRRRLVVTIGVILTTVYVFLSDTESGSVGDNATGDEIIGQLRLLIRDVALEPTEATVEEDDICTIYNMEGYMPRDTFLNVLGTPVDEDTGEADVTMATHMSIERLSRLETLAERWEGSISVVIYVNVRDILNFFTNRVGASNILKTRNNIYYHIVIAQGHFYPHNFLRNVAVQGVHTEFVYLNDVDILPSVATYSALVSRLRTAPPQRQVWVVPAWEIKHNPTWQNVSEGWTPANKVQLRGAFKTKHNIEPFLMHSKLIAYRATDYRKWLYATNPYTVEYEEDFEPYIVMRTKDVPSYHVKFVGRLRNKLSHLLEVFYSGFEFVVLPDVFACHIFHADRHGSEIEARKHTKCAMEVYVDFKKYLIRTYGEKPLKTNHFVPYSNTGKKKKKTI